MLSTSSVIRSAPPGPAPPGLFERVLTMGLIFINMFGTPADWFTATTGSASGVDSDFLLTYGSLAGVGLLCLGLVGNGDAVVRILQAEPLMVIFFVAIGLSPLWSSQFGISVNAVVNLFIMIGLAIILLVRYRPREMFAMITLVFIVGITMDLFWVVAMGPLGSSPIGWDGLGTQKNSLGNHALVGFFVFLTSARTFRRFRLPLYTMAAIAAVLLVGSKSQTSLGAGIVTAGSMVVFVVYRSRKTLVGAVTIVLIAGAAISVLLVTANLETVAGRFGKDATFTGRTALWTEVVNAIERKPWFGYGYAGYWGDALSESHLITAYLDWGPTHSHNALMESALHVGLPLTLVFIAFNLRALFRATDHVRWVRGPLGLFPLVYLTMIGMTSITESGIFGPRFGLTLFVIAVVLAKVGVDEAKASGVMRLDEERTLRRSTTSTHPIGSVPAGDSLPVSAPTLVETSAVTAATTPGPS